MERGSRLSGYSVENNYKGKFLYRFSRWNGENKEHRLGKIKSQKDIKDGSFTVTVWTLDDNSKYHCIK